MEPEVAPEEAPATAEFWRAVGNIVEWAEHRGVRVGQPPLVPVVEDHRAA